MFRILQARLLEAGLCHLPPSNCPLFLQTFLASPPFSNLATPGSHVCEQVRAYALHTGPPHFQAWQVLAIPLPCVMAPGCRSIDSLRALGLVPCEVPTCVQPLPSQTRFSDLARLI